MKCKMAIVKWPQPAAIDAFKAFCQHEGWHADASLVSDRLKLSRATAKAGGESILSAIEPEIADLHGYETWLEHVVLLVGIRREP